jgi:hypothetical protein
MAYDSSGATLGGLRSTWNISPFLKGSVVHLEAPARNAKGGKFRLQCGDDQLVAAAGDLRDQTAEVLLIELRRRVVQQQRGPGGSVSRE